MILLLNWELMQAFVFLATNKSFDSMAEQQWNRLPFQFGTGFRVQSLAGNNSSARRCHFRLT